MSYPRSAQLAAYKSTAAHGGVAAADPHGLVLMLLDGAMQRVMAAQGCIQNGKLLDKTQLLHRVGQIIGELQGSLDMSAGGEIAANMAELYDYIMRRVLHANLHNDIAALTEVVSLLKTLRGAWVEIPPQARTARTGTP